MKQGLSLDKLYPVGYTYYKDSSDIDIFVVNIGKLFHV